MRILFQLTDETVRIQIETATEDLEKEGQIKFPDDNAREEFIDDCTECIRDNIENMICCDLFTEPDYYDIVLDTAEIYGYVQ